MALARMAPWCCAEQALWPPRLWHPSIRCTWPSYANHRRPLAHFPSGKRLQKDPGQLGGVAGSWRTRLAAGRNRGRGTAGSQWGQPVRTCQPRTDTAGFSVLAALRPRSPREKAPLVKGKSQPSLWPRREGGQHPHIAFRGGGGESPSVGASSRGKACPPHSG